MRLIPMLLLILALPAFASDGVLEIEETCAGQTGCVSADTAGLPAAPYALTGDSAWLEGCILGLCDCPVAYLEDLNGFFSLVELPTLNPGPWRLFEIRDISWKLGRGDTTRIEITGSGLYRTASPILDEHRLVLDLELDGVPVATLDSGLVAGALSFPRIEIQALTPGDCFQEGVQLAAAPVPEPRAAMLIHAGLAALVMGTRLRPSRFAAS